MSTRGRGPLTCGGPGFGANFGELTIAAALIALVRKHNCGIRRCWRLARHEYTEPDTGITHQLCRKHHPDHPGPRQITFAEFCEKHKLYLGKQPGAG